MADSATTVTLTIITPIASAALAFAGAVVGQWWSRRSARELDHWRRREETMRLFRWAVELAVDDRPARAEAGLRTLTELTDSELLQPEDAVLVTGIADMFLEDPLDAYTEIGDPNYIREGTGDDDH